MSNQYSTSQRTLLTDCFREKFWRTCFLSGILHHNIMLWFYKLQFNLLIDYTFCVQMRRFGLRLEAEPETTK